MKSDLFPSERRSLRRFLAIYTLSTLFLIAVGSVIFYRYAFHRIIDHQNETLKIKTALIRSKLRDLHTSREADLRYPLIEGIHTALYDLDRNYLIGDFKPEKIEWHNDFWQVNGRLYHRFEMHPYYLGTATVVSAAPIDEAPIQALQTKMAVAFLLATLFVALIARWLGRLFLAPVHQSMQLLDRFIKDTTHELNTPVSTILTNIELFKSLHPELETSEELRRIEIASGRLSRIYDDLTYLLLNHRRHRHIEPIDFSALLKERLAYFTSVMERRGLQLKSELSDHLIRQMDREDAARLIDNLLSNAVKYTSSGGSIHVKLDEKELSVADSGIGMDEKLKARVTDRFFRADHSEGGFGLGLNIVKEIVDFYGIRLDIESQKGVGTKVRVSWEKQF
jgi:two-component system OmpR family sensor kinase